MRKHFLLSIIPTYAVIYALYRYGHPTFIYLVGIVTPLFLLGLYDIFQKKHMVLRNYPVLGHFRYLLEEIRPEIQQYFIESFTNGMPFSREQRSVVYQRAKGELDTAAFGTQNDVYKAGAIWLEHSMSPSQEDKGQFEKRVTIGNEQCSKPYSCSIFNISAMSYGSLSKNAILALNGGAKIGGFYHNTGEGGLSPYHLKPGGDVVWQIGTGYFGCRNLDGTFNADLFKERALLDNVKMIELKISQGAKPGHGGLLPAEKVSKEVAEIRCVEVGKTVHSPSYHSTFSTPRGLLQFIRQLRELSSGKPVGFKICLGDYSNFSAVCKAMIEEKIYPDFVTVDGAEGGTGAAPREFTNYLGTPLNDALNFVHNTLVGAGLRDKVKIIASGKVIHSFDIVAKKSLGADVCNSARGMMFALGCIQALRCNTNHCPVGVATQNPDLYKLLDVPSKAERVARYQQKTLDEVVELCHAARIKTNTHTKKYIKKRVSLEKTLSYAEIYPDIVPGSLLTGKANNLWQDPWDQSSPDHF